MIQSTQGNLLTAPVDALVNTVNCVGVMGKGIALQFKQAYPEMFREYAKAVRAGEVQPGRIHVFEVSRIGGPRYILNFPTKRDWRQNSRMEDIEAGLVDLQDKIRALGIRSIAVPPLGSGSGRLDWALVKLRIEKALAPLSDDVRILLYEPTGAPPSAERIVGTDKPKWTPARALIVSAMAAYTVLDYALSQLEVQKIAYFLQQDGAPMRLKFAEERYGPYADGLHHLLRTLEGHFVRGAIDRKPMTQIELLDDAVAAAQGFLQDRAKDRAHLEAVARLIEGFETPYGMEVLATTHWVARRDAEARTDSEACVDAARAWSRRKRDYLQTRHIQLAWKHLKQQGWLDAPRGT